MKYLAWLVGIVVVLVGSLYVVAFTPFGNSLLQPTIEAKIKEQTKLESQLKTFSLSMSEFEILLELNPQNTIHAKGNFSLFSQAFNIAYRVSLEELKSLKALTQTQLQSSFHTTGTVIGDMAFITLEGKSDVAKSDTSYHVELTDLNPTSIIAKVQNLDLESLLYMGGQKQYATANVNLDVDFKNITPHQLDGMVTLVTKNGSLNTQVMKKDFNITIPSTAFSMNLDATLKGDDVDYTYILNSNLAKITSNGNVQPQPLSVDVKYGVNVQELAVLKPLTGADIRGPLRLEGTVKGNKEKIVAQGKSDIASSDTRFDAVLKEFKPSSVRASVKNMKLQNVLYMLKQPHYADALFSLDADMTDLRSKKLKGTVNTYITKGLLDSKYLTKAYEFKSLMPYTTFSATTKTVLNANKVDTALNVQSSLANLESKNVSFDLSDASLKTDYLVTIPNLDKLYFASQRHLKGGLSANGEVKKGKDLDFTLFSNVAGGKLDAALHNDDFVANLNKMQTLEILDILIYPKVFKSSIDGKLKYNLAQKKGTFNGDLSEGKFTKNQVLDLAKQYASTDLYKEKFLGKVEANINKENIVASLDLKSNRSSIKTKNTKLNSKTKQIHSKLDINANGNPLIITLTGDATSPKVGIDAQKLIEKEATKAIQKEVNKFFKGLF